LGRAQRATEITVDSGERYAIRQGDLVCLFPYLMHHNPEIFENPEQFQLDRFLSRGAPPAFHLRGRRLAMPLMPYGGGVSMCPGRALANTEIKQFVAGLLRRFRLSSAGAPLPRADKGRAGLGVLPPVGDYPIHTS
ncbi:MAG TPA: cytochrome P450, partial [Myxococcota bacterium]|nr:cytochrome P450 [Myxococcota bacterium]